MRLFIGLYAAVFIAACSSKPDATSQVSGSGMAVCRLAESGVVTCWGNGGPGNVLGRGEPDYLPGARLPARVVDLKDATRITTGLTTACAVRRDQSLQCWGIDWATATAGRTSGTQRPKTIHGLAGVVDVSAGRSHVCAVLASGQVFCWGDNGAGQSGQPFTSVVDVIQKPTPVGGVQDVVRVYAGEEATCALHRDGMVACWGRTGPWPMERCPSGPGLGACVRAPDRAVMEAAGRDKHVPRPMPGLNNVEMMAVGSSFYCALRSNGEVLCGGENTLGQLAQKHVNPVTGIVKAMVPEDAVHIAASSWSACSVHRSGEVWCWGALPQVPGQSGTDRGPTLVQGLPQATQVAVGSLHACARVEGGKVWCWGSGPNGETGRGTFREPAPPRPVPL